MRASRAGVVHAHVVGGAIEEVRTRGVRRRRGWAHAAFEAGADALDVALRDAGRLAGSSTGRPVARSTDFAQFVGANGVRDEHPPGGSIECVRKAVLVEVHQRLHGLAADGQVGKDHRARGVVVPAVVRGELVGPYQRSRPRAGARAHSRSTCCRRRAARRCRAGIAGAVVEEIELGIVGHRSPDWRPTRLPAVVCPARARRDRRP